MVTQVTPMGDIFPPPPYRGVTGFTPMSTLPVPPPSHHPPVVLEVRTFIRFEILQNLSDEPVDIDDIVEQYERSLTKRATWSIAVDDDNGWIGTVTGFDVSIDKAYRLTE
jgi:hypothetical protein